MVRAIALGQGCPSEAVTISRGTQSPWTYFPVRWKQEENKPYPSFHINSRLSAGVFHCLKAARSQRSRDTADTVHKSQSSNVYSKVEKREMDLVWK